MGDITDWYIFIKKISILDKGLIFRSFFTFLGFVRILSCVQRLFIRRSNSFLTSPNESESAGRRICTTTCRFRSSVPVWQCHSSRNHLFNLFLSTAFNPFSVVNPTRVSCHGRLAIVRYLPLWICPFLSMWEKSCGRVMRSLFFSWPTRRVLLFITHGQLFTALRSSRFEYLLAVFAGHPRTKAMLVYPFSFARLERSFHSCLLIFKNI
jgi:hypothetical protein